jgi:hypothetical protein
MWLSKKRACREEISSLSPFAKSHPSMSSIQPVHVHFPALLQQPPIDRVRKVRVAQAAPLQYLCHALINEKNAPSEDWSIQSWRSQKVVAIGCIHPTCSGVVERCQLLRVRPSGPDPGSRCLRLGECFICQRYCRLTRRPPVSLPPSHIPVFLGGTILALATHPFSVVAPAGRTCVRDPRIVDSEQPEDSDAFRRACTGKYRQAVFGERVIPALRVHRCWRAARLQPIRRLGRPLRPLFSPFSLDADFLLLLWDIDIQPTFGELFGCI